MNLLLLSRACLREDGTAVVTGRQALHLLEVLHVQEGACIRAGLDNHSVGTAEVVSLVAKKGSGSPSVTVRYVHEPTCPRYHETLQSSNAQHIERYPPLPVKTIDLFLALPRPKVFDKVLQTAATLGVRRLIFAPTSRVEIAYFSSPKLSRASIEESLRLGLEQASVDPYYPEVYIYASWQRCLAQLRERFGYDATSDIAKIVFHPEGALLSLDDPALRLTTHTGPIVLAFGPEGGYIDPELDDLEALGFHRCLLGNRILKVETAIVTALAQVQLCQRHALAPKMMPSRCWCDPQDTAAEDLKIHLPIRGKFVGEKA